MKFTKMLRHKNLQLYGNWTNSFTLFFPFGCAGVNESKNIAGSFRCSYCGSVVPEANALLHQARCARVSFDKRSKDHGQPSKRTSAARKPDSHPKKCTHRSKKPSPQERIKENPHDDDDDLDALLTEMKRADSTCSYRGCKKDIKLIGVKCPFCSARFCLAHNIAEVHGCGEAAKRHARQQITQELMGGARRKPSDPVRRAQLHRKLDRAVDELASSRQRKRKDKKQ